MFLKLTNHPTFLMERCTDCGTLWYTSANDKHHPHIRQPFENKLFGYSRGGNVLKRCPHCETLMNIYLTRERERKSLVQYLTEKYKIVSREE